jgi:hypothetical protein
MLLSFRIRVQGKLRGISRIPWTGKRFKKTYFA